MCKQYKRLGISLKVKGSKRAFEIWTSDWIKHPWVGWLSGKTWAHSLLYCVWQPAIIVLAIHNCCAYLDYNVLLYFRKKERPTKKTWNQRKKKQLIIENNLHSKNTLKKLVPLLNSTLFLSFFSIAHFLEPYSKWEVQVFGHSCVKKLLPM